MSPVYPMEEDKLVADITIATQQDDDGDTALHIAVVQGKMDLVQRLIYILQKSNRDLDTYNNLRQTPLHLAVITHNAPLVGALLSGGADVGALDRNGQTAAHLCCEHADTACLRTLLMHTPRTLDLETRNYEGLTPLHVAVQSGSCELVKLLLDSGADIDAVDIKSGRSPLIHAVDINNVEMVSFLIEGGASVNAQSYSGNSALHSACGRGQLDTVRLLLKNGADSGLKNYHNDTALSIAKDRRVTDVLRGKGTRSLNSKPIEPHPGTPSPHSHSPSPHQHNANGTPAHSPGLAPRQSPLAPSPAPSSPAPAQPQKQASLAPPQEPSSDQTPEEAGLPRATQDRNQPGEGMARRVPPIEVIGCLPPEHRLQFQLIPVGVRALPHQLPSLVPFPVDMQNGYYLEQLYPPPFHSLHPLPHPALPFHPSSCSSSLSVSSSPPSSSSCSPANHSLPPHVPQSRPSSRGSNHQWDGSPEVRGES
ncbi:BCL3 protein, partial [Amia calva]|nr:BCL3 protein [Amia calva]